MWKFCNNLATILQQSCNNLATILQIGHRTCEKLVTILQQSCNNHATILQVGHSTCEKSVTILKQSCNNLTTIFQDVLGRLPMATDPMIMSSTLIESQKSIIYTPTTTLLTLYSIFARLLTILQNIKQSFWTLISSQYPKFCLELTQGSEIQFT